MEIVTQDNINSILLAGENIKVEFKANVKSVRNTLPKIVSAFANTEGGVIIFGYDERDRTVIGTSTNDFEIVKKVILESKLEEVCSAYIVQYEEKELIITQVEKSKSTVIAGGGAYIRNGDASICALESKDVVTRITSTIKTSESMTSIETLERLENKIGQIYDEMRRSQQAHEKELKEQKEEHEKEIIDSKRSNWFFCILSAVIGWALGKFL